MPNDDDDVDDEPEDEPSDDDTGQDDDDTAQDDDDTAQADDDTPQDDDGTVQDEAEPEETDDTIEDAELPPDDGGGGDAPSDYIGSQDEHPNATAEDFEEDAGDWSVQDYHETAQALFGDHPFFGETATDRYRAEGFELHPENDRWLNFVESVAPAAARTIDFFTAGGQVVPRGFVTIAALELLSRALPNVDLSRLHVTLPTWSSNTPGPQPLPPELANVDPADKVDLRPYATPIGDQKQTMRCSAFAWTHAMELAHNVLGHRAPRLAPSYTMLQFQKLQGDVRDFRWAWRGGEGTEAGPDPGRHIVQNGTCRQDLWPDDDPEPRAGQGDMDADARNYTLEAEIHPIGIDDVRKVLSAGCPVHIAMTTGPRFSDLGRDGVLNAAEEPSGDHGWHAMLLVGYIGNYYVVKNSWGTEWGDSGYFYAPKRVLMDAQAEFNALLIRKPDGMLGAVRPGMAQPAAASPLQSAVSILGQVVTAVSSLTRNPMKAASGANPLPPPPAAIPTRRIPEVPERPGTPGRLAEEPPRVAAAAMPPPPPAIATRRIPEEPPRAAVAVPHPVLATDASAHLTCSQCKATVPVGKFCVLCGHTLEKFCIHCGMRLAGAAKFCLQCGGKQS